MDKRLEKYQIKNLKTMRGNEGDAFEASLYRAGKRLGVVWYDGWGGEYSYDGVPADALEELGIVGRDLYNAHLDKRGEKDYRMQDSERAPDIALEEIIRAAEDEKDRKRLLAKARKQTIFVLDGDNPKYEYRAFPARYELPACLEALRQPKYAGSHPRVLNGVTGEWESID